MFCLLCVLEKPLSEWEFYFWPVATVIISVLSAICLRRAYREEPGPDLFAEDAETDLYAAIDLVAKKIEQQIRKRHSKYKARKHSEASSSKRRRQEAGI